MSRLNLAVVAVLVSLASGGFASDDFAAPTPSEAFPLVHLGKVVSVTDGDTLKLQVDGVEIIVRLAQIDAPEMNQPYGRESRAALAVMVANQVVRAEVVDRDHYDRDVAEVYLNGNHINRYMVERGFAWAYPKYARSIHVLELEDAARAAERGLWKLPESQRDAPWVWRHSGGKRSYVPPVDPSEFRCGTKLRCKEMASCAEAHFHLEECQLEIDGDRDGIPCEALCRR